MPFRARTDLQAVRVDYSGQSTWVLKDPVTLELFHLTTEEYFLFERIRQSTSLGQLQREFEQTFSPRRISIKTLQAYLDQLHGNELLLGEEAGHARQLLERGKMRRRQKRLQRASQWLSIRLPGIDVAPLLDWPLMNRWASVGRWRYARGILTAVSLLGLWAMVTLVKHFGVLIQELPSLSMLFEPRYLLPLIGSLAVVKLLHELAHALACKYLGGRPQEIGVMLLAMMPVFYCDVSDVWRFPNKWHRMAVSAAGMGIELILAAVAILVWSVTGPGLLHAWCLNIVIVCSLGTLLVNANPLLRYDGYYLLADWLEIPNLSMRGSEWLKHALRGWLMAEPTPDESLLSPAKQRMVVAYAIGSRVYLTMVLVGLFVVMQALARSYHLENLVNTLAVVLMLGFFVPVGLSWIKWLMNPWMRGRIQRGRFALFCVLTLGLTAIALGWPIQGQVTAPVVLVPASSAPLYATEEGMLVMALPAGAQVEAGDVVAQLVNPRLEQDLAQLTAHWNAERLHREQLLILRVRDEYLTRQLPTVEATLADVRVQLAQQKQRAERLVLRAPCAGQVLAPAKVIRPVNSQQSASTRELVSWSGSLLEPRNVGAWVESGTLVSSVADLSRMEAWVAVSQADVPQVVPNQSVRLVLASVPGQILVGQVVQVAQRATHPDPDREATPSAVSGNLDASYHLVRVRLQAQDAPLWIGARGQAKIVTSDTTFATLLARQLRTTFQLPW
ncbi:MAG: HlyD family efflux transporter periplasmic adaptor subunit [Pirellulales bacterium]